MGFRALTVIALLALLVTAQAAPAAPRHDNSAALITGEFADSCRDFAAHSSKDISHVEVHHADGRVVKQETINGPDYWLDGAAGGEIEFAILKSGTTRERFDCVQTNSPPTSLLGIKTPPVDQTLEHCYVFFDGTACEQSAPRTAWSSVSDITNDQGSLLTWGCGAFGGSSLCSFTFSFRGTSSSDPDNDIASWSIDFGDGTSASGNWSTDPPTEVAHDYAFSNCVGFGTSAGLCPVTLTVTDFAGQSDFDTMVMAQVDQTPD